MGVPLTRAALDAVLTDEPRDDCAHYVPRATPDGIKADCETDGHYLCLGCARCSGRRIGRELAENPHIRKKAKAAQRAIDRGAGEVVR